MKRQDDLALGWIVGVLAILFQLALPCSDGRCAVTGASEKGAVQKAFNARIPFVVNNGQVDAQAAYIARMFGGALFVSQQGELVYALQKSRTTHNDTTETEDKKTASQSVEIAESNYHKSIDGIVFREFLIDSDNHHLIPHTIQGKDETPTRINYFKGNDPSQWKTDIATYAELNFGEVYEKIDFRLHSYGNNVEKLFTIHPGGKVENIKLGVDGADSLRVNNKGSLEVTTSMGIVTFTKPVAYQIIHGKRVEVEAAYKVNQTPIQPTSEIDQATSPAVYSFEIASYDTSKDLIIDPLLASTFLGGGSSDMGIEIALDSSGNIIISGLTDSLDFPSTTGAYEVSIGGGQDIFVAKLNPAGDQLLFVTYIGGSGDEFYVLDDSSELYHFGMAVDYAGDIYVANNTESTDFPVTQGAYDTTFNGGDSDLFVAKLSSTGDQLLYATFLGGSNAEHGGGIDVDSSGNAYVAGTTYSTNFSTTASAYAKNYRGGENDMFVTKINPSGSGLIYSTFLGGSYWDESTDCAVDSSGCLYVLGGGDSIDYPTTTGAFDTSYNDDRHYYDIYLTKLNAAGSGLVYSTFLGGNDKEWAEDLALDVSGNVYISGGTSSTDFPVTAGVYETVFTPNGSECDFGTKTGFLAKMNATGTTLSYSTFLPRGVGMGIAVDNAGNAYMSGTTCTSEFPATQDAVSTNLNGNMDAIVVKVNPDGNEILYATYFGGSGPTDGLEVGMDITVDDMGDMYVVGITDSTDFPVESPVQSTYGGGVYDAFVVKIETPSKVTYYPDSDGDGYGDPGNPYEASSQPAGYVTDNTDCNDNDSTIHPGATEISGDGIDQDCDGSDLPSTDCDDVPGKVILTSPSVSTEDSIPIYSWEADPCATWYRLYVWDDNHTVKHSQWYESSDIASDGICSVTIASTLGGDSYEWFVQTWNEYGTGNWSDGITFSVDTDDDQDGYTVGQGDCNDNDKNIHPGAIEICGDNIDQDCDGRDISCSGDDPWIGNWIQVNFLSNDDNGVWDQDDPDGIGFVAQITESEWVETDEYGNGCSVTYSYSVDHNNKLFKEAISVSNNCSFPLGSFLNEFGTLEFYDGNNIMIEYFDVSSEDTDTILAFKWMRQ